MKKIITILAAASALVSCTGKFEEYNKNPNQMELGMVSPASLLPNTIYNGVRALNTYSYSFNGELIQYTVRATTDATYHRFDLPNGKTTSIWENLGRWAANADHIINLSGDPRECNLKAIGLTMRAFYLQTITDCFGDIPYSDAFGFEEGNFKPKFDSQKDVYLGLIRDLEQANSLYNASYAMSETEVDKDLLYKGDIDKWRRFTNSLKLRLLMRASLTNDPDIDVPGRLQEMYSNPAEFPVFDSEDNAAILRYSGTTPFVNPYGASIESSFGNVKAAEKIIELLLENGDPRISIYFTQVGGSWTGVISGESNRDESGAGTAAKMNKYTLGDYSSPFSLMNLDEVYFIWAEAAQRGLISGGDGLAESYYYKGIEASMKHWSDNPGVDVKIGDNTIDQYKEKVRYNGTYEQLMTQKHLAMFWVGLEAWAEWRRTGIPELTINPDTMNDHILPTRFFYPLNTAKTNPDNYAEVVERMKTVYGGQDDLKTPVWWSKQANEQR